MQILPTILAFIYVQIRVPTQAPVVICFVTQPALLADSLWEINKLRIFRLTRQFSNVPPIWRAKETKGCFFAWTHNPQACGLQIRTFEPWYMWWYCTFSESCLYGKDALSSIWGWICRSQSCFSQRAEWAARLKDICNQQIGPHIDEQSEHCGHASPICWSQKIFSWRAKWNLLITKFFQPRSKVSSSATHLPSVDQPINCNGPAPLSALFLILWKI